MEHIKLVVMICEEALEPLLLPLLLTAGAKGYSVCEARGRGNRGDRDARWSLSANIRIEVLCSAETAEHIVAIVHEKFSINYGLVIYVLDADVLRTDKF